MSDFIREQKIKEVEELREMGINPFPYKYERTHTCEEVVEEFEGINPGETKEDVSLKVCGRIMAIRDHGKSAFFVIKDFYSKLQAYIRKSEVGAEKYDLFKKHISTGDFIGITGFPFRSKTGELSIYVKDFELLTKSVRPMPEKWHGLKDKEIIYRQRYVDLLSNEESMNRFKIRFKAMQLIREFMISRGYVEVETPMLHYTLGGASARPFVTHMNAYDIDMYMRIAPELYLKRFIVGGFDRVFEINRNFRNEGVSYKHSPEFTMMELYQSYADYNDMMELQESLFAFVVKELFGTYEVEYQGNKINFEPPWDRVSMRDFIKRYLSVDILEDTDEKLLEVLKNNGVVPELKDRGHLVDELWDLVEDKIVNPTFITEHPVEISPLAKRHREDPRITERFESIVLGREMSNAFSELNDPIDQKGRFDMQAELREGGDEEAQMMDLDFLRALEYGLPPTAGMGIGIDRFVMFLTDASSIRDVIAFPMVKPDKLFEEYEEEEKEEE